MIIILHHHSSSSLFSPHSSSSISSLILPPHSPPPLLTLNIIHATCNPQSPLSHPLHFFLSLIPFFSLTSHLHLAFYSPLTTSSTALCVPHAISNATPHSFLLYLPLHILHFFISNSHIPVTGDVNLDSFDLLGVISDFTGGNVGSVDLHSIQSAIVGMFDGSVESGGEGGGKT